MLDKGQTELGLRVLSNLAEMDLARNAGDRENNRKDRHHAGDCHQGDGRHD